MLLLEEMMPCIDSCSLFLGYWLLSKLNAMLCLGLSFLLCFRSESDRMPLGGFYCCADCSSFLVYLTLSIVFYYETLLFIWNYSWACKDDAAFWRVASPCLDADDGTFFEPTIGANLPYNLHYSFGVEIVSRLRFSVYRPNLLSVELYKFRIGTYSSNIFSWGLSIFLASVPFLLASLGLSCE